MKACDDCKSLKGMYAIDKTALNLLIKGRAPEIIEYLQKSVDEPDFEPNDNLGEGMASEEEMDYRTDLLLLLAAIFPAITEVVKDKKLTSGQKIDKINTIFDGFVRNAKFTIETHTSNIYDTAVKTANSNLKNVNSKIKSQKPDISNLNSIITQQLANIADISNYLKGRLIQGLLLLDVDANLREDQIERDYGFVDSAFNEAQNRLDAMGYYGWFKSNEAGLIGTYALGMAILGSLVADWLTCEDMGTCSPGDPGSEEGPICEDCHDLADNGPYSILNWPSEPHFGCRCGMGEVYLLE